MFRFNGNILITKTSMYIFKESYQSAPFSRRDPTNHPEYVDECEILTPIDYFSKCKAGAFTLANYMIYKNGKPFINLEDHGINDSLPTKIWAHDYNGGLKLFVGWGNTDIYDCIEHKKYSGNGLYVHAGIVIQGGNSFYSQVTVFGESFNFIGLINDVFTSAEKTKYTIREINGVFINYIREFGSAMRTKPALKFD